MRRCHFCKQEEFEATHTQKCPYYWPLLKWRSPKVDGEWCFIEDTDGCPLSAVTTTTGCEGCVDCEIDA